MKQQLIVGIDVSKRTLDLCVKPAGITLQVSNDLAGFKLLKQQLGAHRAIIVMEHTGLYSRKLEAFLQRHLIDFCKVPALQIKRSLGVVRGKNDRIDAMRIAEYGWLRKDQLIPTCATAAGLHELQDLLTLRAKLVKDRSGFINRAKELQHGSSYPRANPIHTCHEHMIKVFSEQIAKIEACILETIKADKALHQTFLLLKSIKGVGTVIAAQMIASTDNFKKFDNARKFNCYAGLAPFSHESGCSIRHRSRVSHLASKKIKTLLNLSAFCAIRVDAELKQYYTRRVAEGKGKMSCINIIRAKIVARMFAVVKRQSPYEPVRSAA